MPQTHIYIHYPYCLYKCHYCDFNSYAYDKSQIPQKNYTEGLLTEIHKRAQLWQEKDCYFLNKKSQIASLFFGGGTPSLMNPSDVARVIAELQKYFVFSDKIEITLESNPGTVDQKLFAQFKQAGINRISLGVQSLNDRFLATFGRIHTATQALQAIDAALAAGFERVNADLIFGFPGQTLKEWEEDLELMLTKKLKHHSCYALTAEMGTQFSSDLKKGVWQETDSDLFFEMLKFTHERLAAAGLPAYEVSNFAVPGEESVHNLGYWKFHSYLGLGAGACSQFVGERGRRLMDEGRGKIDQGTLSILEGVVTRTTNHKAPEHYMRTVSEGGFFDEELIDQKTAMKEFIMMGLRLREGICGIDFKNLFGVGLQEVYQSAIQKNVSLGRLLFEGDVFRPTQKGFFENNALVLDFFDLP